MKIEAKTRAFIAELIIESGNTRVVEDVATSLDKVDEDVVEQLITAAFELRRWEDESDASTVRMIIEAFLSQNERDEILEWLQNEHKP